MIKTHSLLVTLMLFASIPIFATVRTVSNNPSTLAQFSSIQAAIDASSNGDTVYVHGSAIIYPGFILDGKGLVIIGPGWAPDKNQPLRVLIGQGVEIRGSNSSNSEFNGLVFTFGIKFNDAVSAGDPNGGGADNIRMIRNEFRGSINYGGVQLNLVAYSHHLYEGCYFSDVRMVSGSTVYSYNNFMLRNNLFRNSTFNSFTTTNGFIFDHNLFYASTSARVFCQCEFMSFTNNIFNKANVQESSCFSNFKGAHSCTFTSNITFQVGGAGDTPWIGNGNIDAGGNISNQSPLMASQTNVNTGDDNPLLNFTISSGPANNSSVIDSKDLGLLFDTIGGLNWTNSRNTRLPRISKMNIVTPVIAPGGTLSVTVEANKSN